MQRYLSSVFRQLPAIALFMIILVAWEAFVRAFNVPTYLLPSPSAIAARLSNEWLGLVRHLGATMTAAIGGFLLGGAAAFLMAVLFFLSPVLEKAFYPWAIIIKTVPIIAIAPLLTVWLGFGMPPKVVIAALVCFFPVLVNTSRGLQAADQQTLELMKVLKANWWQVLWKVRIPTSLPYLFAALKISSSMSVTGAIVAEFTGSSAGIGTVIVSAGYQLDTSLLFASVLVSSMASIAFFYLIVAVENLCLYWPGAKTNQDL